MLAHRQIVSLFTKMDAMVDSRECANEPARVLLVRVQLARRHLVAAGRALYAAESAVVFQVHVQSTGWEQSGGGGGAATSVLAAAPQRARYETSPALVVFVGVQVLSPKTR